MRSLLFAFVLSGCASSTTAVAPPKSESATTLDPQVQAIVREELDCAVTEWKPSVSIAIVLDPATGAILGLGGRDGARDDASIATTRTFVTGSTLKTFTLAAAFEEKTIAPDAKVDCATRMYGTAELHDASPHGVMSIADMFAVSSNVGAARVYDSFGLDRLYTWLRRFHFDDAPSHLPTVTDGNGIQAAMFAGGELAETTPMQMAAAYGVVFNGGSYVAPTTSPSGAKPERILRDDTVKTLTAMLENVVASEIGTGKSARIEGHRVAGKTGTADHHGKYWATFVGSVLDAKRRMVVMVGFELPTTSGYSGGSAAAPAFQRIARRLL